MFINEAHNITKQQTETKINIQIQENAKKQDQLLYSSKRKQVSSSLLGTKNVLKQVTQRLQRSTEKASQRNIDLRNNINFLTQKSSDLELLF